MENHSGKILRVAGASALIGLGALGATVSSHLAGGSPALAHAATATAELAPPVNPGADANLFVGLARQVVPSVVNISTVGTVKTAAYGGRPGFGGSPGPEDLLEEFFGGRGFHHPRGGELAPPEARTAALGTGFVIDPSGIILTNQHVVANADEIKVSFTESPDEKPVSGKVIGRDPELDVALIQVKTDRPLRALPLGDSDALQVGEYVAAVGNPFGQGHSFTHGLISAKGRTSPGVPLATYLQTDAPINPGNSGGPLINLRGEVIGINNAIDARAQGIGFAIPINVVKNVLPQLRSKGSIERGYLGAMISDLNPELAEKLATPKNLEAPLVVQVAPGGPAYRAGLRPYDVITEFNGKPVKTAAELTAQVVALPEGSTVPLKFTRAGTDRTEQIKVKLGKRPAPEQSEG